MMQQRQQPSITDGVLFYLHNTSSLGRWCGLCKTTLDLWGHFHACYHRKYECLSACVREVKTRSYKWHWQLRTHSAHTCDIYTHPQPCALFSGDSELWPCAERQIHTPEAYRGCVCVSVCERCRLTLQQHVGIKLSPAGSSWLGINVHHHKPLHWISSVESMRSCVLHMSKHYGVCLYRSLSRHSWQGTVIPNLFGSTLPKGFK